MRVSDVVSAQTAKLTVADLTGNDPNLAPYRHGQDLILTVTTVDFVQFDDKSKFKLGFQETDKGFILNVTNRDSMVWNFGDETDGWIGQRVSFFPTTTRYNNQQMPCIRIRPAQNPAMQVMASQPQYAPPPSPIPQQAPVQQQPNAYQQAQQGLVTPQPAQGQQYDERNPPPVTDLDSDIPF